MLFWNCQGTVAFGALKNAMIHASIFSLPYFTHPSILEADIQRMNWLELLSQNMVIF